MLTLAIWALVAWSATYWMLRFNGNRPGAAAPVELAPPLPATEPGNVARIFGPAIERPTEPGAVPLAVDPSTRFSLVGVVANRASVGVALLSVEGKPARPYRVGSTVDEGYTLKSVTARSATLAAPQTGAVFTVNLSASPAASAVVPPAPMAGPPASPARALPTPRGGPASAASMSRASI